MTVRPVPADPARRHWLRAAAGGALLSAIGSRAPAARPSTAGPAVEVSPPLPMPGLGRERRIRVWRPAGYDARPDHRWPVLYLHDGQNLFDDATSFAGEWGVDEALAAFEAATGVGILAVGIDHGGEHRSTELTPGRFRDAPRIEGPAYARFVTDVVKPFVDGRYRTRPQREHTAVMGASLGGLMAHHLIATRPDVFGAAGILSPAYWLQPDAADAARRQPLPADARVWFYAGGRESATMEADTRRVFDAVAAGRPPDVSALRIEPDARHDEAAWRAVFPDAVRWLFRAS